MLCCDLVCHAMILCVLESVCIYIDIDSDIYTYIHMHLHSPKPQSKHLQFDASL